MNSTVRNSTSSVFPMNPNLHTKDCSLSLSPSLATSSFSWDAKFLARYCIYTEFRVCSSMVRPVSFISLPAASRHLLTTHFPLWKPSVMLVALNTFWKPPAQNSFSSVTNSASSGNVDHSISEKSSFLALLLTTVGKIYSLRIKASLGLDEDKGFTGLGWEAGLFYRASYHACFFLWTKTNKYYRGQKEEFAAILKFHHEQCLHKNQYNIFLQTLTFGS